MFMSRGQWRQLYRIVPKKCAFQGPCSCKYEPVKDVNIKSLDIQTLFVLLLNICDLNDEEKRNISELQKCFLTLPSLFDAEQSEEDKDEDDYEDSFFALVEQILLDIPIENGSCELKENIEFIKQRSREYFRKFLPVVRLYSDKERRTAERINNLINMTQEKLKSCGTESVECLEANKGDDVRNEVTLKSDISDNATDAPHHRYYVTESFPHFHYVYNLVRDCEFRLRKIFDKFDQMMTPANELVIRISFAGDVSKEDLRMISKKRSSKKQHGKLWVAVPLICFEQSKIEELKDDEACHKFLIKVKLGNDDTGILPPSIVVVDRNREKIQEALSSCLEDPLIRTLEKWTRAVESVSSKAASKLTFEMKSVLKHILSLTPQTTLSKKSKCVTVVPPTIKEYLYGRTGVNSFGLWRNGAFKVFVARGTDRDELIDELKEREPEFFEKYKLEIEAKKFVQKKTLKQGDAILRKDGDKVFSATLGGLVQEENNDDNLYGLTCNHIYTEKNQPSYANVSDEESEIGKCVYTTRDKSCDFAVVKIEGNSRKECDISFRRDDGKRSNALVYTDNDLGDIGVVYKRGAETNLTKGNIVSWEHCAVVDDENNDNIFLIEGVDTAFSEPGDSGSVVFSRSHTVQQNSVDVLGMVYASNFELREDGAETIRKDETDTLFAHSDEKGLELTEPEVKPGKSKTVESDHSYEKNPANIDNEASNTTKDPEFFTCCFRMDTAFGLLEEEENISVKFEDVSSSDSSSHSPDSEDSDGKQEK
ncbi:uncharacterized protein LOC134246199 [Saccostrea cucullata]|uniref:uncharacterized protein LOC134246199 n=1 Tax=Saccostrea cuccullata TaxID=36930 RepID=UPI002ED64E44